MEAMMQPTIRVVAVIAEGVPEADTKKLIAYARKHNKILLGPATVGGVQVSANHEGCLGKCSKSMCGGLLCSCGALEGCPGGMGPCSTFFRCM